MADSSGKGRENPQHRIADALERIADQLERAVDMEHD